MAMVRDTDNPKLAIPIIVSTREINMTGLRPILSVSHPQK